MNDFEERALPQDLGAERGVLGGMLMSPRAIEEVAEIVKGRDFYLPKHEKIFDAAVFLFGRDEPADAVTVANELTRRGQLDKVGGHAYLHDLTQAGPTWASAGYYAEIVRQHAVRRRLIEAGTRAVQMGYATDGDDIAEVVDKAQAEIQALSEAGSPQEDGDSRAESVMRVLEGVENRGPRGLPTGFKDLDALLGGGLTAGQMIIYAGRPAMGKSTLGLDTARHVSDRLELPSVFFSLEMGHDELTMRQLSAEATVSLHRMRSGTTTDEDWKRLSAKAAAVSNSLLHVDDDPGLTLMQIRTKARRHKRKHGLALIVVDYVQLLKSGTGTGRQNRQEEVSEISRGLKLLAKELAVPVIAIAQLNRGPEQRTDKKPMMSDLRESGSLEQDADVVVLLHREAAYEPESPRAGEADLIVAKHRNGPTGTITVAFQGHYSRFADFGWTPHNAAG